MGHGNGKGGFFDVLGELGGMMQAACCCVCVAFLLGPIFLLVGVSFVGKAATDTRGEALRELQGEAGLWEDVHRADFEGLELSVQVAYTNNLGTVISQSTDLPAVTVGDEIDDIGSEPDDLAVAWTPLRYSAQAAVPGNGPPGDTYRLYAGAVLLDQAGPFVLCEQSYITLSNCRETCSSRQGSRCTSSCCPCAERCTESGGVYRSVSGTMRCAVTLQLQEVCFVAPSGAGVGGASVDPALWSGQTTGFADSLPDINQQLGPPSEPKVHTSAGMYVRVPPATFCPENSVSQVQVTVRSADDPYVIAAESTDYTFDFGATQAENAAAGGTFIVLGLIFSLIPICAGYAIYSCAKQKRNPASQQHISVQQVRFALACTSCTLYSEPEMCTMCTHAPVGRLLRTCWCRLRA
jgi:hypothetical protein|eukprot:COSAG03_NODE_1440_length_4078_cov_1.933652_4_plen_408_part_00